MNKTLTTIFLLTTYFITYEQSESEERTIELPELSKEIISMRDQDQK